MNYYFLFAGVVAAVLWFWYWLLSRIVKDKAIVIVVALGASVVTAPILYIVLAFTMLNGRPLK